jgi:hypothetical protein
MDAPATLRSPKESDVAPTPIPPSPPHSPAEEICDLLSKLDVAIPGLGRSIACLLTGAPITEKIKKVGGGPRNGIRKKSLGCKDNKSAATGYLMDDPRFLVSCN